jgi:P-type E1-E2 ATPase
MVVFDIPGYKKLRLENLVLDYNGTLASDGHLIQGVRETLISLSAELDVHVVTADTFGKARSALRGIRCQLSILPSRNQDTEKLEYVRRLGSESTVCIGNGRNDHKMLKEAALGIAVCQEEGAFTGSLQAADVICTNVVSALELLLNPLRLVATLRS